MSGEMLKGEKIFGEKIFRENATAWVSINCAQTLRITLPSHTDTLFPFP